MNTKYSSKFGSRSLLLVVCASALSLAVSAAKAQVGIDGSLGPEWIGVTPYHIDAAPYGQPGVGTPYDVYTRADANYVYVLVNATPLGEGNDNWTATIGAQLGNVVNLGFDINPPPVGSNGSDIVIETENNRYATFDNANNVLYNNYSGTNGIVQASTPVRGYDTMNPGFSVELGIPWTMLETDPDMTGNFQTLGPTNPAMVVRYSQSFDGTFDLQGPQFGDTRFGEFVDPNFAVGAVPEASTWVSGALCVAALGGFAVRRRKPAC